MSKFLRFVIFMIVLGAVIAFGWFFVFSKSDKPKDTKIIFTNTGNVSRYEMVGFDQPKEHFTWTIEKEASITIPTPKIAENSGLKMFLYVYPFFYEKKLTKQVVDIYVNDTFLYKWTLTKNDGITLPLPKDIKDKNIKFSFKIPTATSPKELKMNSDTRKYGIAVAKMILSEYNLNNPNNFATYNIGDEILFTNNGNAKGYTASGWSAPEQDFTWTNGKDAVVNMFINDPTDKKLQLNVSGHAVFGAKAKNQKITVYANDQELTTWEVGKDYGTYAVNLPESIVQNGALQIRFHVNNPIKIKQDPRSLGMAVNMIKVSQVFAAKTKSKMANWVKNNVLTDSEKTTEKSK